MFPRQWFGKVYFAAVYFAQALGVAPPVPGQLKLLDVHGAMPPSEFGTVIPNGPPVPFIPSTEPIERIDPVYRKLSTNGILED